MNLRVLRGLPGSPGTSGLLVRPSGFSGRLGRRSASFRRDLIVITYKHRGQSEKIQSHNKTYSNG